MTEKDQIIIDKQTVIIENQTVIIEKQQRLLDNVFKNNKRLLYVCIFLAFSLGARALYDLLA